jgi:hypothetical protein
MLKVTVELVPGGDETKARPIARMTIANVSALADISDYAVEASAAENPVAGMSAREDRARVQKHDRRQSVWSLVAKAAAAVAR